MSTVKISEKYDKWWRTDVTHEICTLLGTSSLLKNRVVKRTSHRTLDFLLNRDNRMGGGLFSHHCTPKFPSLGFCVWKACIVSQDTNKSVFFPFHLCRKIIKKGRAGSCTSWFLCSESHLHLRKAPFSLLIIRPALFRLRSNALLLGRGN